MNILMTICGRGGSKGVPGKNIGKFLDHPLVYYTIAAAKLFADTRNQDVVEICLNSDSPDLLAYAEQVSDVYPIVRPEEMARDNSAKVPVVRHCLETMERERSRRYDFIIDLDITAPLRTVADIEHALEVLLDAEDADISYSVVPARKNPYFNMVEVRDGIVRKIIDSEYVARQQAPEVFDTNASIYCYRRDSLMNVFKNTVYDGTGVIFSMKDTAVLDIDSEQDYELMCVVARYLYENYTEFAEIREYIPSMSAKSAEGSAIRR
ncbi:MAG: acylneuraminate cytidylyltransferase family protein [bacterium]|nr:acylneuraminate cytidylyltransferase family protein [bacterium]